MVSSTHFQLVTMSKKNWWYWFFLLWNFVITLCVVLNDRKLANMQMHQQHQNVSMKILFPRWKYRESILSCSGDIQTGEKCKIRPTPPPSFLFKAPKLTCIIELLCDLISVRINSNISNFRNCRINWVCETAVQAKLDIFCEETCH